MACASGMPSSSVSMDQTTKLIPKGRCALCHCPGNADGFACGRERSGHQGMRADLAQCNCLWPVGRNGFIFWQGLRRAIGITSRTEQSADQVLLGIRATVFTHTARETGHLGVYLIMVIQAGAADPLRIDAPRECKDDHEQYELSSNVQILPPHGFQRIPACWLEHK